MTLIVLNNGNLPAHTVCPAMAFDRCGFARECGHRGLKHDRSYSCGALRAFAMTKEGTESILYPYGNTETKRFGDLKLGAEFVRISSLANDGIERRPLLMKTNYYEQGMTAVVLDGLNKGQEIVVSADELVLVRP